MTRLGYLGICATLGLGVAFLGCGSSTPSSQGAGGATSLPGSGGATSLPGSGGATSLPGSGGATSLPGSGGATSLPGSGGATSLPGSGGATGPVGSGGSAGSSGQTTKSLESLVPRDNEVPGWKIDSENSTIAGKPAAIARTMKAAVDLVDGSAEDYWAKQTPQVFAWQDYLNASLASFIERPGVGSLIQLYMMEMPSEAEAAGLYKSLIDEKWPLWQQEWTEPSSPLVGTKSRIANSGADWWVNFYKGIYYVEVRMTPSYGPESAGYPEKDPTQKAAALSFAAAVASKL